MDANPGAKRSRRTYESSDVSRIVASTTSPPFVEGAGISTRFSEARNEILNMARDDNVRRISIARLGLPPYHSTDDVTTPVGANIQPALQPPPSAPSSTDSDPRSLLLLLNLLLQQQQQEQLHSVLRNYLQGLLQEAILQQWHQEQRDSLQHSNWIVLLQQAMMQQQQQQQQDTLMLQQQQQLNHSLMLQNDVAPLHELRLTNAPAAQTRQNSCSNEPAIGSSLHFQQEHANSDNQGGIDAATRLGAATVLAALLQMSVARRELGAVIPAATSTPVAAESTMPSPTQPQEGACQKSHPPVSMASNDDGETLSEYQCLLREQMELFEASIEDVKISAQGRNKPIVLRQVGIQCKHCAHLPHKQRLRGAVYFPTRLSSIYQSAQNMGVNHFTGNHCPNIPEETNIELERRRVKKSLHGGGKKYWADKAAAVGVIEVRETLMFGT